MPRAGCIETVATPADGVTAPVGVIVARLGVTFVTFTCGELALVTVLPLASFSETFAMAVPFVPPPFAMSVVGETLQPS